MPFKIDKHTGILMKKAARLFEQVANQGLDKLGVTYAQTIFLVRLWHEDGQSQIGLAKSAGLAQPSVVRILDRMERDGLITRTRNQEDRRVFNFYLTSKAQKACQKLESQADIMHTMATSGLNKKDVDTLNNLITQVVANLEKALKK
jgi:MarR family transcriptional regulator, transcriptional regulator for hemolysin